MGPGALAEYLTALCWETSSCCLYLGQLGRYGGGCPSTFYAFPTMQHLSTTTKRFFGYARRGALLLALGAAGPAVWGQSFGPMLSYPVSPSSSPFNIAIGDLNRDGKPDILAPSLNKVDVLLGLPNTGFAAATSYITGASSFADVALGDVNGDGFPDIVTTNAGAISVLRGQNGGFAAATNYATGAGSNPQGVALADMNGDGRLDIVSANNGTNDVSVLLGQASGFAAAISYATSSGTSSLNGVAVGDVNLDGRLDIVTVGNKVGVLLGQVGGFAPLVNFPAVTLSNNNIPHSVLLRDVNGDGRPDIIIDDLATNAVVVFLSQAAGGFASASYYAVGTGAGPSSNTGYPQGLDIGDLNGDNILDVVSANYLGSISILMGQGGGVYSPPVLYYASGTGFRSFADVALGDVNGDGRLDIIFSNVNFNAIGVFLNTGTYTPLATARPTAADLTLAPNPAHDAFAVQLPAGFTPTQAELLNTLGQVVRRPAVGAARFTVETSGLAPGLYTLRLQAGGTALARRVVVE